MSLEEIRDLVEGASKDGQETSNSHQEAGNLLDGFKLEELPPAHGTLARRPEGSEAKR
jgi:hypothetical protein